MLNFDKVLGFSQELEIFGKIGEISLLNDTITLVEEDNTLHTVKREDVVLLEVIGKLGDNDILNHDVLGTVDGKMYEIELQENGKDIQLHLLNAKLERVETGEIVAIEHLQSFAPYADLIGNIHELEVEDTVDFNITIVKDYNGTHYTYFYACNNKANEEVDLIKVVYMGDKLLKEEEYERRTISYEDYLKAVEDGTLKEVSPQELFNFVTGVRYGEVHASRYEDTNECECDIEEEDYDDEDDTDEPW